jgi:RecA/RadA recombinase
VILLKEIDNTKFFNIIICILENKMTDFGLTFLKDIIKEVGGDYASLASEIIENESYVDTGSYILNALVSGSIFGGISQNKITALAAPESCGKTFIALSVVKNFLNQNEEGFCLYFDTESAITKTMLLEKGIDVNRVIIINVVTIEEFRNKLLKFVDMYTKKSESDRKPCLAVLDSLGMLSTTKEITDTLAEKDTRDMTKAQLIKGAFRMLTLKMGEAGIPLIVNNHLYDSMSMYSPKEMSGGCLVAGTEIITKTGHKPIETVEVDDLVLTKEGVWRKVLETHKFTHKETLEIEFDDGTKVKCTPEHKFFVDGEWVEAKNLNEGISVEVV